MPDVCGTSKLPLLCIITFSGDFDRQLQFINKPVLMTYAYDIHTKLQKGVQSQI